jgi:hypothetical protein
MSHCREISPAFDPPDLIKALIVVECESNGDPLANDRNWGHLSKRPMGLWSHMSHYWEARSRRALGYVGDPYDTTEASWVASYLVYHDRIGWGHWRTCSSSDVIVETLRNHGAGG